LPLFDQRPTTTAVTSPLYDKWHPILGAFVNGCSFLEFWTPKVPLLKSPGDKKIIWKKKSHKNHPKKRARALPFFAGPLASKIKVGVEQEKFGHVR
jgi:hypothetical protein